MPKNSNRAEGVTYVGPRAFVVAFCVLCGVFLAVFFGVGRLTDRLETATPDTSPIASVVPTAGSSLPLTVAENAAIGGTTVTRTFVRPKGVSPAVPAGTATSAVPTVLPDPVAKHVALMTGAAARLSSSGPGSPHHVASQPAPGLQRQMKEPAPSASANAPGPYVSASAAPHASANAPIFKPSATAFRGAALANAPHASAQALVRQAPAPPVPARPSSVVTAPTLQALAKAPVPPIVAKAPTFNAMVKAPGPSIVANAPTLRARVKAPAPPASANAPSALANMPAAPAQGGGLGPLPSAARASSGNRAVANSNAHSKNTVGAALRIPPSVPIATTQRIERKRAPTLAPRAAPDESRPTAKQLLVPFERTTTALTSGQLTPHANAHDALVVTAALPILHPLSAASARP